MTGMDAKDKKNLAKAEENLRMAQEKSANDAQSNGDAVRDAEDALSQARQKAGNEETKGWPPKGMETK